MSLAEQTARARWPGCAHGDDGHGGLLVQVHPTHWRRWSPESNADQCDELIEEAKIAALPIQNTWNAWPRDDPALWKNHSDRRTAVCLAYVAYKETAR